jgi:TatD DNase family protein
MLVDSHAHLDMSQFEHDVDDVVNRAAAAGVREILNVGYDPGSLERVLDLTGRYEGVFAALGIHPHNARDYDDELESELKRVLLRKKVIALGEIGLDYYRDLSPREAQRDAFRRQIGLALYFKKPIIVHCRDAFGDVIDILKEEGAREVGGSFHAFSGGYEEACAVLELGFIVGIGGPVTYKNSKLPGVVEKLPSSSIVLETDCPYLTPVPYRGKRNEPAYIEIIARKVAEIMRVDSEDVERAAEMNYRRVLKKEPPARPEVAYGLRDSLYINVTGTCTNNCIFCSRTQNDVSLYGHNLRLVDDPSAEEMSEAARSAAGKEKFKEIVFCGYGEPTTRLTEVIAAARALKDLGLPTRLNTNGQGNLIHRRNIVPELEEVFDGVSVSLNAHEAESYERLCCPDMGRQAYDAVLDFAKKAASSRMECTLTVLDHPDVDIDAARALAGSIPGVEFRVRTYHICACIS